MILDYAPLLLEGAIETLKISAATFIVGNIIGLITSLFKRSPYSFLKIPANFYNTLIIGVPELLILLLAYFGGTAILSQITGDYYEINAFYAGVFSLSLIFGGYSSEVYRGSFESVDKGLIEAADSFGFSKFKLLRRITIPLALRHALPGLSNLWLVLLKESALLSIIGMEDLMRKTQIAVGATKQAFTFYFICSLIYLAMTFFSQQIINIAESRVQRGFN